MKSTMRADTHLWIFRLILLAVLVAPALNCAEDGGGEGCSCDCLDTPDDDDSSDDDDSGISGADDDDTGDDDDDDDDDSGDDDDDDSGPDDPTSGLPACEGSVLAAFAEDEIEPPAAASDGYLVPSADTIEAIASSIEALTAGDAALALAAVAVVGYELCRGEGDEAGTALWRPAVAGSGRAQFAWRAVGARPLIVGVPHPWFEDRTLAEGVDAFDRLNARALIVSGTHRCANVDESPCDGLTDVCGGDDLPFRESDMAHSADTVYQVAHEWFGDLFEEDLVVSFHGMAADGVSLSDGTEDPTTDDAPVALLAAAVAAAFGGEDVTTCNDYDGATVDVRLCGTTNVQGRYVNGSAEPCATAATAAAGRFLHIEQSGDVREDFTSVVDALGTIVGP